MAKKTDSPDLLKLERSLAHDERMLARALKCQLRVNARVENWTDRVRIAKVRCAEVLQPSLFTNETLRGNSAQMEFKIADGRHTPISEDDLEKEHKNELQAG